MLSPAAPTWGPMTYRGCPVVGASFAIVTDVVAVTPPPGSKVTSWRTVRVEKKSIFPPAPAFTITAARSPPSAWRAESTPARANAACTDGSEEKTFRCPAAAALAQRPQSRHRASVDRQETVHHRASGLAEHDLARDRVGEPREGTVREERHHAVRRDAQAPYRRLDGSGHEQELSERERICGDHSVERRPPGRFPRREGRTSRRWEVRRHVDVDPVGRSSVLAVVPTVLRERYGHLLRRQDRKGLDGAETGHREPPVPRLHERERAPEAAGTAKLCRVLGEEEVAAGAGLAGECRERARECPSGPHQVPGLLELLDRFPPSVRNRSWQEPRRRRAHRVECSRRCPPPPPRAAAPPERHRPGRSRHPARSDRRHRRGCQRSRLRPGRSLLRSPTPRRQAPPSRRSSGRGSGPERRWLQATIPHGRSRPRTVHEPRRSRRRPRRACRRGGRLAPTATRFGRAPARP